MIRLTSLVALGNYSNLAHTYYIQWYVIHTHWSRALDIYHAHYGHLDRIGRIKCDFTLLHGVTQRIHGHYYCELLALLVHWPEE